MHAAIISAKNPTALDAASTRLAEHLRAHPEENIADICYTLTTGRTLYQYARVVVCADGASAAEALDLGDPSVVVEGTRNVATQPVTFLFSGQGSQHIFMGRELYSEEPVFRMEIDRCAKLLKKHINIDIRKLLFPQPKKESEAEELLRNTQYAQPAIFVVSYALAKLWMKMGARPSVMLGHSIGEFAAACIAGRVLARRRASRCRGAGSPDAEHAARRHALHHVPGAANRTAAPVDHFGSGDQFADIRRRRRPRRRCRRVRRRFGDEGDFVHASAHLARISFEHDGSRGRSFRQSDARHYA